MNNLAAKTSESAAGVLAVGDRCELTLRQPLPSEPDGCFRSVGARSAGL